MESKKETTTVFRDVKCLALSYTNILKIDNLVGFERLVKLQLDNNIIEKIENLGQLTNLEVAIRALTQAQHTSRSLAPVSGTRSVFQQYRRDRGPRFAQGSEDSVAFFKSVRMRLRELCCFVEIGDVCVLVGSRRSKASTCFGSCKCFLLGIIC